jgi:hypothetical protein
MASRVATGSRTGCISAKCDKCLKARTVSGGIAHQCLGEVHLRQSLQSYACYYNDIRTHWSLEKGVPVSRQKSANLKHQITRHPLADFTTTTPELKFSVHTGHLQRLRSRWSRCQIGSAFRETGVDFAGACSTVTTVSVTEELTVLSIDTKGIARSNSANKAFDSATCECASVVSIAGAPPLTTSIPLGEP